jgi:hypothetical protein
MELTKDNYLYGWGHNEEWTVNIDPPRKKVKTYFLETLDAVEYIYANKTGKFQVLYSGGLDSQYVCEVLIRLNIDFDPVIINLKNNAGEILNWHDIKYAYEFCESKNIKPITYNLNFEKFVDDGKHLEIAASVECGGIAMPSTMYVASQLDGFSLIANDPPYLLYQDNVWYLNETEYTHGLLRFYKKYNVNGCPFLLSYTPEMMLSFLLDPRIQDLVDGKYPGKIGTNSSKSYVFNNGSGFNLPVYDFVSKERIKFHGFEEIKKHEIMMHPNMKIFREINKQWLGEYLENYHDAVKRLSIYQ